MNALNNLVSFFTSIFDHSTPEKPTPWVDTPISEVLERIKRGTYAAQVKAHRDQLAAMDAAVDDAGRAAAKKAAAGAKKKLPCFSLSGTYKVRASSADGGSVMATHSQMLQIDIDKLGERLASVSALLRADPHVLFVFVSPSGRGVKAGMLVGDVTSHLAAFRSAQRYMLEKYSLTIDNMPSNQASLCYVSHDQDLYVNEGAVALPTVATLLQAPQTPRKTKDGVKREEKATVTISADDIATAVDPTLPERPVATGGPGVTYRVLHHLARRIVGYEITHSVILSASDIKAIFDTWFAKAEKLNATRNPPSVYFAELQTKLSAVSWPEWPGFTPVHQVAREVENATTDIPEIAALDCPLKRKIAKVLEGLARNAAKRGAADFQAPCRTVGDATGISHTHVNLLMRAMRMCAPPLITVTREETTRLGRRILFYRFNYATTPATQPKNN